MQEKRVERTLEVLNRVPQFFGVHESNLFLRGLPATDVKHPLDTPCSLELCKNTRYSQRLLWVKVGYALVLHHPGVIYIADFRRGDCPLLNISVLHLTRAEAKALKVDNVEGRRRRVGPWKSGRSSRRIDQIPPT